MDKGKLRLAITIGVLTLFLLAIFMAIYFLWPRHTWTESYEPTDKEPYGGYVLSELLKNYNPNTTYEIIKTRWDSSSVFTDASKHNTNYVFIGTAAYLDSLSAHTLAAYVARGNNALIIAPAIPYYVLHELGVGNCNKETDTVATDTTMIIDSTYAADSLHIDTVIKKQSPPEKTQMVEDDDEGELNVPSVNLNFTHPQLNDIQGYAYHYIVDKDTLSHPWTYVLSNEECAPFLFHYAELGTIGNEHINFIRVKFGKGSFLLHTTPLAFSNYSLLDKKHQEYAERALSHLSTGNIYWDEYSRSIHQNYNHNMAGQRDETPLRYILSQPSLRWAWYLLLAMAIIYTLFQLKRKQRIIPVLATNNNTSVEFAQTVSRLYYQQNDHRKLVMQQFRLFLSFIRSRYYINTQLPDEDLVKNISGKSGLSEMEISMIFGQFRHFEQMPDITEEQLIAFHQSLEKFYRECQ